MDIDQLKRGPEGWRDRAQQILDQYDAATAEPLVALANYGERALSLLRAMLAASQPAGLGPAAQIAASSQDEPHPDKKAMVIADLKPGNAAHDKADVPDFFDGGGAALPDAEIVREYFAGRDRWDVKIFNRSLKHGTKLYAGPSATAVAAVRRHPNILLEHAAVVLTDMGLTEHAAIVRGSKIPNDGSTTVPCDPFDERNAFVQLIGYDRPEMEGVAQEAWDHHRKTWLAALAARKRSGALLTDERTRYFAWAKSFADSYSRAPNPQEAWEGALAEWWLSQTPPALTLAGKEERPQ